jgi:hypothetical protein
MPWTNGFELRRVAACMAMRGSLSFARPAMTKYFGSIFPFDIPVRDRSVALQFAIRERKRCVGGVGAWVSEWRSRDVQRKIAGLKSKHGLLLRLGVSGEKAFITNSGLVPIVSSRCRLRGLSRELEHRTDGGGAYCAARAVERRARSRLHAARRADRRACSRIGVAQRTIV